MQSSCYRVLLFSATRHAHPGQYSISSLKLMFSKHWQNQADHEKKINWESSTVTFACSKWVLKNTLILLKCRAFSLQSTGTLIVVSRYSGATFCPPSVFSRGIGWEVKTRTKKCSVSSLTVFYKDYTNWNATSKIYQGISIILDGMCGTLTGTAASV